MFGSREIPRYAHQYGAAHKKIESFWWSILFYPSSRVIWWPAAIYCVANSRSRLAFQYVSGSMMYVCVCACVSVEYAPKPLISVFTLNYIGKYCVWHSHQNKFRLEKYVTDCTHQTEIQSLPFSYGHKLVAMMPVNKKNPSQSIQCALKITK